MTKYSKMNIGDRVRMVKAMEYIARCVNDEEWFEMWLQDGVADGYIERGDFDCNDYHGDMEWYIEDEHFAELMNLFLRLMSVARKDGLYCDGVLSK